MRSPENVVDEMEMIHNKYGVNQLTFYDDAFTVNRERVMKICKELHDRKLDLIWDCGTRVDMVDRCANGAGAVTEIPSVAADRPAICCARCAAVEDDGLAHARARRTADDCRRWHDALRLARQRQAELVLATASEIVDAHIMVASGERWRINRKGTWSLITPAVDE